MQPDLFYQASYMDPPWFERGGGKIKRGADRHYDLVKTKDMPAVIRSCPHWGRMADISYNFMWATNNFLPDALWLMGELGYRYITNFPWIKDRIGLGQYARGQHELLLMGVRGKANRIRKATAPSTWLGQRVLPRRAHSQKPPEGRALVEHIAPGPYLELFAREEVEGWTTWGNEIGEGETMTAYASRTGTKKTLAALAKADWRILVSPTGKIRNEGFPYCLDNGAWTAYQKGIPFDGKRFMQAVELLGDGADFIAVPDIVCGGMESFEFSMKWQERLVGVDAPLLLCVQPDIPLPLIEHALKAKWFDGIFVGGDTKWKERTLADGTWKSLKLQTGCYLHVGRVNTVRRIKLCAQAHADSFDGSSVTRFVQNLERLDRARRRFVIGREHTW